ncbi:hypothetical protein [Salisediminibacterium selenitireducens]|uniref:Uncharacterized protein n=1 Tax=Bacillus selenitireducens (strain ATCC 700615 / DSM 15326 / MLS10) TaxID=439292 RepID=D6XW07_BACIE|nr:hypothetical protein [Salisediminibacterium selenitireducens]ADH97780.1 protein of unknown function DUF323 [[Bacillus] selenitireducens MLS10]
MKKMLATAAAILFVFAACSNDGTGTVEEDATNEAVVNDNQNHANANNDETDEEEEVPEAVDDELQAILDHFEGDGFDVGEQAFKAYEMVGAVDGFGVDVNGEEIELYLYDEGSEELEELRSEGQFDMDGFPIPGEVNGNIALMSHEEHPDQSEILSTFHDF